MIWFILGAAFVVIVVMAVSWPSLHKRLGTTVGDKRVTYRDMVRMPRVDLEQVLHQSVILGNRTAAFWAVEVLSGQFGSDIVRSLLEDVLKEALQWPIRNDPTAVVLVFELLARERREQGAWRVLEETLNWTDEDGTREILGVVIEEGFDPPTSFVAGDFSASCLVGTIYLDRARSLVGVYGKKDDFISKKKMALRFFGNAREQAHEPQLVERAAALYGRALYLVWPKNEGAQGE